MSARPTSIVAADIWANTPGLNAVTRPTNSKIAAGFGGAERPLAQFVNFLQARTDSWIQYLSDGTIALVNLAISAGLAVVGGITTDTLVASSAITGATVTSTGAIVSGGNASIGGTASIHGTTTLGIGADLVLQGSGYVSHPTRSRSVAITQNRVTTSTVAPTSPSFGTPGLIIPTSCNCYLEVDALEPNEAIVTLTVNAPGTASTAACSLFKFDPGSGGLVSVPGTSGTSFISGKAVMTVTTPVPVGDFCYLIEVQTGANTVQLLSYDVASQA